MEMGSEEGTIGTVINTLEDDTKPVRELYRSFFRVFIALDFTALDIACREGQKRCCPMDPTRRQSGPVCAGRKRLQAVRKPFGWTDDHTVRLHTSELKNNSEKQAHKQAHYTEQGAEPGGPHHHYSHNLSSVENGAMILKCRSYDP